MDNEDLWPVAGKIERGGPRQECLLVKFVGAAARNADRVRLLRRKRQRLCGFFRLGGLGRIFCDNGTVRHGLVRRLGLCGRLVRRWRWIFREAGGSRLGVDERDRCGLNIDPPKRRRGRFFEIQISFDLSCQPYKHGHHHQRQTEPVDSLRIHMV